MTVHTRLWISVIALFVCTVSASEWKQKCEEEWGLQGAPMPDSVDWKFVYEAKPLGRNLLKNPSPYGLSKDDPPPNPDRNEVMPKGLFQPQDDFSGWITSLETLPRDKSGIPPGVVVDAYPTYIWFTMEQVVDLEAEGLWDELLDEFQPEIVIQDWYEESRLDKHLYELHVKLLGAENNTISEYSVTPTDNPRSETYTWKEVSHVFSAYGPGVRYIHFQHRLKNVRWIGMVSNYYQTLFADSSVIVKPIKTSP